MKITETCACGARLDVASWIDQNAWDAASYWRANHNCPNLKPSPAPRKNGPTKRDLELLKLVREQGARCLWPHPTGRRAPTVVPPAEPHESYPPETYY